MQDNYVFDKAKYHFESVQGEGLPLEQAYVHTGLYFGWLLERGLVNEEEFPAEVFADFKARRITGPQIYKRDDGALMSELLTSEGDAFSRHYFYYGRGRISQKMLATSEWRKRLKSQRNPPKALAASRRY
jgi:hypothetical protein